MKRYFEQRLERQLPKRLVLCQQVSSEQVFQFRREVEKEVLALGGSEDDFRFIGDAAIRNTILRHGKAKDLAWAILQ